MIGFGLIIVATLVGCSSSEEVTSTPKKVKTQNVNFADLPEKDQIKFKFLFHNANKERILNNYEIHTNIFDAPLSQPYDYFQPNRSRTIPNRFHSAGVEL